MSNLLIFHTFLEVLEEHIPYFMHVSNIDFGKIAEAEKIGADHFIYFIRKNEENAAGIQSKVRGRREHIVMSAWADNSHQQWVRFSSDRYARTEQVASVETLCAAFRAFLEGVA